MRARTIPASQRRAAADNHRDSLDRQRCRRDQCLRHLHRAAHRAARGLAPLTRMRRTRAASSRLALTLREQFAQGQHIERDALHVGVDRQSSLEVLEGLVEILQL